MICLCGWRHSSSFFMVGSGRASGGNPHVASEALRSACVMTLPIDGRTHTSGPTWRSLGPNKNGHGHSGLSTYYVPSPTVCPLFLSSPPHYPPGDSAIIIPISQMSKRRLREGKPPAQHHTMRFSLSGSPRENERETQSWGNSSRFSGVGMWRDRRGDQEEFSPVSPSLAL